LAIDTELDVVAALSVLRRSLRTDPHQALSQLLGAIDAWLVARRRSGVPVAASELDEIVLQINDVLSATGPRRTSVVRVRQRLHLSSGMRFH
jgi:ubiquinone biosynthesis protein UbiJ